METFIRWTRNSTLVALSSLLTCMTKTPLETQESYHILTAILCICGIVIIMVMDQKIAEGLYK